MLVNQTLLYSVFDNTNNIGLSYANSVLMLFEQKRLKGAHSPLLLKTPLIMYLALYVYF